MIKYAQLRQCFDVIKMQQEVLHLQDEFWKPHYNENHYEGSWTILPLRSLNGNIENNISIHRSALQKNDCYKDTLLLNKCSYLKSVISFFDCEKMSVRLMNLNAGALIKEHADFEMSFEDGESRFHVPIFTNNEVSFFIEDEKVPMAAGECWYLNLSRKHRVNNFGPSSRIHLVIDCIVNDWVKNILQNDVLRSKEIEPCVQAANFTAEDKIKIIQQLRLLATPVSIELAKKMENDND